MVTYDSVHIQRTAVISHSVRGRSPPHRILRRSIQSCWLSNRSIRVLLLVKNRRFPVHNNNVQLIFSKSILLIFPTFGVNQSAFKVVRILKVFVLWSFEVKWYHLNLSPSLNVLSQFFDFVVDFIDSSLFCVFIFRGHWCFYGGASSYSIHIGC